MKFQYFHNHERNSVYLNIVESNIWTRICVLIFMSRDKIGTIVDKMHTDIQIMWRHLNILVDKVYIVVTKRVKVAVNRNIYIYYCGNSNTSQSNMAIVYINVDNELTMRWCVETRKGKYLSNVNKLHANVSESIYQIFYSV